MKELGKKIDCGDQFVAGEGELNFIYGHVGSGKTYLATSMIHEDLARGDLVYCTWPIKVQDFDDRESFVIGLMNLLLFREEYYKINCSKNLHYINAETGEVDGVKQFEPTKDGYVSYLNKLNHCKLYIDEAWRVIDSYEKTTSMGIEVRNLILVTRHKYRVVNLIAQRPTSVQATARGNMSRFYRCEKLVNFPKLGWVVFKRSEFQDMVGDNVDETVDPVSVKRYLGSKRIFNSYNSYYYGDLNPLHKKYFEVYILNYKERFLVLFNYFLNIFSKVALFAELLFKRKARP